MAAAISLTTVLLAIYLFWLARQLGGSGQRVFRWSRYIAGLVCIYCVYALLYLSAANAKTEGVRAEYRSLHPLLRLAVGTLIVVDEEVVVTDGRRRIEDYADMGLPANPGSRHIVQPDGYAHAIDLRTVGRPEWKNFLMEGYLRLIGLRTLRHVGTADHLHVSLPRPTKT